MPKKPTRKQPAKPKARVTGSGQPIFGQPKPSPDPSGFKDPVTDQNLTALATLGAGARTRGRRS